MSDTAYVSGTSAEGIYLRGAVTFYPDGTHGPLLLLNEPVTQIDGSTIHIDGVEYSMPSIVAEPSAADWFLLALLAFYVCAGLVIGWTHWNHKQREVALHAERLLLDGDDIAAPPRNAAPSTSFGINFKSPRRTSMMSVYCPNCSKRIRKKPFDKCRKCGWMKSL